MTRKQVQWLSERSRPARREQRQNKSHARGQNQEGFALTCIPASFHEKNLAYQTKPRSTEIPPARLPPARKDAGMCVCKRLRLDGDGPLIKTSLRATAHFQMSTRSVCSTGHPRTPCAISWTTASTTAGIAAGSTGKDILNLLEAIQISKLLADTARPDAPL